MINDAVSLSTTHFSSIYMVSLVISNLLYEVLQTANVTDIDTSTITIMSFGVNMFTSIIVPNTE